MTAILPTDMDDAGAPPSRQEKRQPMTNPPSRRVNAPWADAAFEWAARAAAFLTLSLLLGIANGVYHPADYSILGSVIEPKRLGRAFSFHTFSGFIGGAVAPMTMVLTAIMSDARASNCGANGMRRPSLICFLFPDPSDEGSIQAMIRRALSVTRPSFFFFSRPKR